MIASGYRVNTTGALNNVGAQGLCWSSSPASGSVNAGGLNFNSTYVGPVPDHNRANAFTVRCVQHLQAVFYFSDMITTKQPPTRNAESYGFRQCGS